MNEDMKKQPFSRGKLILEKALEAKEVVSQCDRGRAKVENVIPQRSVRKRQACRRLLDFECNFTSSTPKRSRKV